MSTFVYFWWHWCDIFGLVYVIGYVCSRSILVCSVNYKWCTTFKTWGWQMWQGSDVLICRLMFVTLNNWLSLVNRWKRVLTMEPDMLFHRHRLFLVAAFGKSFALAIGFYQTVDAFVTSCNCENAFWHQQQCVAWYSHYTQTSPLLSLTSVVTGWISICCSGNE